MEENDCGRSCIEGQYAQELQVSSGGTGTVAFSLPLVVAIPGGMLAYNRDDLEVDSCGIIKYNS